MSSRAHVFVDGAYLRCLADQASAKWVNPRVLASNVVSSAIVQEWGTLPHQPGQTRLARVLYYDARPEDAAEAGVDLQEYWNAIELLNDTELGFGTTRGGTKRKPPRQKGVDTLLAVDMLVGAFTRLFDVAILIAGDADFVPLVNEVRRQGAMVVVAAEERSLADDLRRAADRFVPIGPGLQAKDFPTLRVDGRQWSRT